MGAAHSPALYCIVWLVPIFRGEGAAKRQQRTVRHRLGQHGAGAGAGEELLEAHDDQPGGGRHDAGGRGGHPQCPGLVPLGGVLDPAVW